MLSLRPEQLHALEQDRVLDLERRLHSHVCCCFPSTTRGMSDAALREVVRHGILRARAHGIGTERGVCKYLNLMFVFGRDFDRDPSLSWAQEIFDGARVKPGLSTIELIYRVGLEHEAQGKGLGGLADGR